MKVFVVHKDSYIYGVFTTSTKASRRRRQAERDRELSGHIGLGVFVSISEKELDGE